MQMTDYIKELVSVPGAAVVAGILLTLTMVRKGVLTLFRDRRELRVDDAYAGIVEGLRGEVVRLREAVTELTLEVHRLREENAELRRVVATQRVDFEDEKTR